MFRVSRNKIQPEPEPVQPEQKLTEEDIKLWKENNQDPKTGEMIESSIVSTSPYVKLYKESIKILISIRLLKSSSRILTIEDCKYIRKSLPDAHVCINDGPYYDHLFTKYFLKKKDKYDKKYSAYGTDIYLYLELYNILKRKQYIKQIVLKPLPPEVISKILLKYRQPQQLLLEKGSVSRQSFSSQFEDVSQNDILTNNIDYSKFKLSGLSIENVMIRLYNDIINILNLKFTKENYSHVINSFTILKFVEKIYKISDILNTKLAEDIKIYIKKYIKEESTTVNDFLKTNFVDIDSSHYFTILEDIYNKIILLYDYFFPYFIHDGIYETNCIGTEDVLNLNEFNYDTNNHAGKVTILPEYTKNKIVNKCYLTEELYKSLLYNINYYGSNVNNNKIFEKYNTVPFTRGDIEHIVNQLLINLENYNEDESEDGLEFLNSIFKIQLLSKVNKEIEKENDSESLINLRKLKSSLEFLLLIIQKKSMVLRDILKLDSFKYFIEENLRVMLKNIKISQKNLTFFNITDDFDEQITLNFKEGFTKLTKLKGLFTKLKIIGKYSYFLNINLGTEENKRILIHSFLDVPIFNNEDKNNELRLHTRFLKNFGTANEIYKISTILKELKELKIKPTNPKEIYNKYCKIFSTYNGGRKKRIVSNKKRSSKKKTI